MPAIQRFFYRQSATSRKKSSASLSPREPTLGVHFFSLSNADLERVSTSMRKPCMAVDNGSQIRR
jgi:hypothetical protein